MINVCACACVLLLDGFIFYSKWCAVTLCLSQVSNGTAYYVQ